MSLQKYIFIFFTIGSAFLIGQSSTGSNTSPDLKTEATNAAAVVRGNPAPKKKSFWDPFSFEGDLIFYYRNSPLFEITGNEQTFVTAFRSKLLCQKKVGPAAFKATVDFFLTESLSAKGRLFENMNPPQILPNQLDLEIKLGKNHTFTMGIVKPLYWQLPQEVFGLPVMYKVGAYPNGALLPHTLVLGFRDVPILYAGLTPWYDTGLFYKLSLGAFRASLGVANGEEGLDANSSKNVSLSLGAETPLIKTALVGEIGEFGSVPIKEWRHFYKAYFYAGKKNVFGAEALLVVNGIKFRETVATNLSANGDPYLQNQYGYADGFYNPFSIPAISDVSYPFGIEPRVVFSFSSFAYMDLRPDFPVVRDRFQLTSHVGIYVPDLFRTGGDELKPKYRGFLRLMFYITPFFRAIVSDTFTYDPLFVNTSVNQFYDREPRTAHTFVDNEVFIGFDLTLK
ncbi:MAG: hypothetical protein JNM63_02120 [Spirochaetia bacterium]|nr:hypothetical protein [Spirochaetia bacterium]